MLVGTRFYVFLGLGLVSISSLAYQAASTSAIQQQAISSYAELMVELSQGGGPNVSRLVQMIGTNASSQVTAILKLNYAMGQSEGDPSRFAEMLRIQFSLRPEAVEVPQKSTNSPATRSRTTTTKPSTHDPFVQDDHAVEVKRAKKAVTRYDRGFELGFSINYLTEIDELEGLFESNLRNDPDLPNSCQTVEVDLTVVPIGLAFRGKKETSFGLRTDFGAGPILLAVGATDSRLCDEADFIHFDLPIVVSVGYTLLPRSDVSPYLRAGFSYHVASGDYVEGSKPGLFGAVGVAFSRQDRFIWGLEVSVDKAAVELENYSAHTIVELETIGTVISLFFQF